MSLRGVIASFGGPYTVTRTEANSWDGNGRPVAGGTSTIPIIAVEEPLEGSELQDPPEGQSSNEKRLIITTTQLRDQRDGAPDVVTIDGDPWRVESVAVCKSFGDVHYECVVARAVRGA